MWLLRSIQPSLNGRIGLHDEVGPARCSWAVGFECRCGTLTVGQPRVVELVGAGNPVSDDEVLRLAASAEGSSEHPLAQAVVDAAKERKLALVDATGFNAVPGHGLEATVDGHTVLVGNAKLMRDRAIDFDGLGPRADELEGAGRTVVRVAVDGKAGGLIAIADAVRPSAKETIDRLHNLGIQVAMLTGDNQATADRIATELGLDTVFAEVLPGQKADKKEGGPGARRRGRWGGGAGRRPRARRRPPRPRGPPRARPPRGRGKTGDLAGKKRPPRGPPRPPAPPAERRYQKPPPPRGGRLPPPPSPSRFGWPSSRRPSRPPRRRASGAVGPAAPFFPRPPPPPPHPTEPGRRGPPGAGRACPALRP